MQKRKLKFLAAAFCLGACLTVGMTAQAEDSPAEQPEEQQITQTRSLSNEEVEQNEGENSQKEQPGSEGEKTELPDETSDGDGEQIPDGETPETEPGNEGGTPENEEGGNEGFSLSIEGVTLEKNELTEASLQRVTVTFSGELIGNKAVILRYYSETGKQEFSVLASEIVGNTAFFTISHTEAGEDVFVLEGVTCTVEEEQLLLDFADYNLSAFYKVTIPDSTEEEPGEEETDPEPEEPLKNGFVTESDGKTYYYKDGELVKGELYEQGFWYFLDLQTGEMKQEGFAYLPLRGIWCYYNADGHRLYGEQYINEGWYYLTPETGAVDYEFAYIPDGGKWVYYGPIDGRMRYGEQYIDGGWYYLTPSTGAVDYEFAYIPDGGKWVYYGPIDGRMRYGEQYIDGGWYYLTPGTGAVDYEWAYIPGSGKWVYYDAISGRMIYGQHKISGKWYYFDDVTGRVLTSSELAARLVNTAYSELGKNTDVVAIIAANGGLTCPYGPCMSFVWYVFHKAGLDGFLCDGAITGWPHHNYDWYNSRGLISRTPRVGDIVFFRWGGWADTIGASSSHAGIVVGVSGGSVRVIDALADGLGPHTYSVNYYALLGFANPFA